MTVPAGRRVALVAGGGSGIGRGCAIRLAGEGRHIVVLGRTEAKLLETCEEIASLGGSAEAFAADVRDWERLGELATQLADTRLDLLINCAGGQFLSPAAQLSRNGWQSVVDINLSGSFNISRQLYPVLAGKGAAIVHVVADVWQRAAEDMCHSGAARAGVISLVRSLALEWAADGIRVNAVSPGLTETPAVGKYGIDPTEGAALVPLGRYARVDEVVDAILFMAKAEYITGEVLTIDGGYWLR